MGDDNDDDDDGDADDNGFFLAWPARVVTMIIVYVN
jgi:hypothetical protein